MWILRQMPPTPTPFPGGPGQGVFLILSQQWRWAGWEQRLLGNAWGATFLSLLSQRSRLWARWEISNPFCEGDVNPEKPDCQRLSLVHSSATELRGAEQQTPPGPLKKGCNCPPGSPTTTGCSQSSSLICLPSDLLQNPAGIRGGSQGSNRSLLLVSDAHHPQPRSSLWLEIRGSRWWGSWESGRVRNRSPHCTPAAPYLSPSKPHSQRSINIPNS